MPSPSPPPPHSTQPNPPENFIHKRGSDSGGFLSRYHLHSSFLTSSKTSPTRGYTPRGVFSDQGRLFLTSRAYLTVHGELAGGRVAMSIPIDQCTFAYTASPHSLRQQGFLRIQVSIPSPSPLPLPTVPSPTQQTTSLKDEGRIREVSVQDTIFPRVS